MEKEPDKPGNLQLTCLNQLQQSLMMLKSTLALLCKSEVSIARSSEKIKEFEAQRNYLDHLIEKYHVKA